MGNYIFLDNWVLSDLRDEVFRNALLEYILDNDYTVLINTALLIELYNPGWKEYQQNDRVSRAVDFLSSVPCSIVDSDEVITAEIENFLYKLDYLPIKADLTKLEIGSFLRVLRSDPETGVDIQQLSKRIKKLKSEWPSQKNAIMQLARDQGYLVADPRGNLKCTSRESFLLHLDFRFVTFQDPDELLKRHIELRRKNENHTLSLIRITSLAFYYLYVDIDSADKISTSRSDIVDFLQIGFVRYCRVITVDTAMYKLLDRIGKSGESFDCKVLNSALLRKEIGL